MGHSEASTTQSMVSSC